jgi:hypothetical protein
MNYEKITGTIIPENNFKRARFCRFPIASCLWREQLPIISWGFLIAGCLLLIAVAACKYKGAKEVAVTKDQDVYYTCSMHPNIMQE